MNASDIRRWVEFRKIDSRDTIIADLYRVGFSSVQIGDWVGLTRARICQILGEQGVERRRHGEKLVRLQPNEARMLTEQIRAILDEIEADRA